MGVPVSELTDQELEEQGSAAHASRNWVFLHGTAEHFKVHTDRMLALEQEYIRRFPKRTWQSVGDIALADTPDVPALLREVEAAGGRLHKLELHHAARRAGLDRAALAALYRGDEPVLRTEKDERVLTDTGRALLT